MDRVVDQVLPDQGDALLPPEVEVSSPEWFAQVDPAKPDFEVTGRVAARGTPYACRVLVAPGGYPGPGDFVELPSPVCDGKTRTAPVDGRVALVSVKDLKALFPSGSVDGDFNGRESGALGEQPHSGRPNTLPYAFVVKIVATRRQGATGLQGSDQRQAFLHRDRDMLAGFPVQLPGDGEASPLLADLDGDNRNELVIANSDGLIYAFRRDGSRLPGFPASGDPLPHTDAAAAFLGSPAVGDLDGDGVPEIVAADMQGKVYVFNARGERVRRMQAEVRWSGRPVRPFENVRDGVLHRTQLGFIASPVLADLDGDGRQEIVAAAMDRHVYAWHADGTAVHGFPVQVVDRDKVKAIDPETHRVIFKPEVPGATPETRDDHTNDQGAIIDTPAVGDINGDGKPEIVVGTNEAYTAGKGGEGELNVGANSPSYQALGRALGPANGRVYALRGTGDPDGDLLAGPAPWLDGWPFKVAILEQDVLPLVGEGVSGAPVIGHVPCGGTEPRTAIGLMPAAGVPYLVGADGQSCYGRDTGDRALTTDTSGGATDTPYIAAFGHPAFGTSAFYAPVAGVQRALDVVLPEYQRGGHDYLAAWDPQSGTLKAGWPHAVNDLQFLTGPSIADIDGDAGGQEVVSGSASDDLQGMGEDGSDLAGWPKLTGDWTVANPVIGSFGTLDTAAGARKAVIGLTRSGQILGYSTASSPCTDSAWPRFHHDNANSGDAARDAGLPGTPMDAALDGGRLTFTSPGDDLLCGTPKRYVVRTDNTPITPASFAAADAVGEFPGRRGGSRVVLDLQTAKLQRHVAVRAIDEAGNAGRPAVVDRGGPKDAAQPQSQDVAPDSTPAAGGEPRSAPQAAAPQPSAPAPAHARGLSPCVHGAARLTSRGLGAFRLGAAGTRTTRTCVVGGGRVTVLFSGGRAVAIASTAPGHRYGRLRPGLATAAFRRAAPHRRAVRPGVYRLTPRSRVLVGVRGGRVRFLAVSSLRSAAALRALRL